VARRTIIERVLQFAPEIPARCLISPADSISRKDRACADNVIYVVSCVMYRGHRSDCESPGCLLLQWALQADSRCFRYEGTDMLIVQKWMLCARYDLLLMWSRCAVRIRLLTPPRFPNARLAIYLDASVMMIQSTKTSKQPGTAPLARDRGVPAVLKKTFESGLFAGRICGICGGKCMVSDRGKRAHGQHTKKVRWTKSQDAEDFRGAQLTSPER
jgi:hypothetical protein